MVEGVVPPRSPSLSPHSTRNLGCGAVPLEAEDPRACPARSSCREPQHTVSVWATAVPGGSAPVLGAAGGDRGGPGKKPEGNPRACRSRACAVKHLDL